TNLKYMRKFYKSFPISQTLSDQLSWSHYLLLSKIDEVEKRKFYFEEAISSNWSVRELDRQISSLLFERLSLSKDKESTLQLANEGHKISKPEDLVKDPYFLEFLGLKQNFAFYEKDLEDALIKHLQEFLLELGKGFCFVSRQQRITLDGEHYFIDLVFYNRIAKCFVLIHLKIGKLTHQDIGQMQMYTNYYKRNEMMDGENEPIGILLCSEKNEAVVKYTLPEGQKQIFASKYKVYLPSEEELKEELIKERGIIEIQKKI
ncbi:MAG: PDDEXK nuclease domain-containing protein, partial [Anaeromicrobium sp.]|uniref:PDDEXK nuclease domain-containing protein n=1 Tax=Anaeromicrobium sp. TaxID=1929132 RepID=UPI0025DEC0B9